MMWSDTLYSRVITWLRIVLPFGALALLSTIFLYSRGPDPISQIPFVVDGLDPNEGEQVSTPFYAGTTDAGHAIRIRARQAQLSADVGMSAADVNAVLDFTDGSRIEVTATVGRLGQGNETLLFEDGVTVESSTGYTMRSDGLVTELDSGTLESVGTVDADGPGLTLTAGQMRVTEDQDTQGVMIEFSGGVTMTYLPQTDEAE